jgi:hypothetical protein
VVTLGSSSEYDMQYCANLALVAASRPSPALASGGGSIAIVATARSIMSLDMSLPSRIGQLLRGFYE